MISLMFQNIIVKGQLSVIIPCLNEEEAIIDVLESIKLTFRTYSLKGEVIVVDDGSLDNTFEYSKNYALKNKNDKDIKYSVLKNKTNKGIGYSFMKGVTESNSEFVVMIPGDGENNPIESLKFFNSLKDHVEIIIPFVINGRERGWKRYFTSKLYTRIINLIFNTTFNYTNGTVIYKKNCIKNYLLEQKGFFYQTEAIIRLKTFSDGISYAEVPVLINPNQTSRVSRAFNFSTLFDISKSVIILFLRINFILMNKNKFFRTLNKTNS